MVAIVIGFVAVNRRLRRGNYVAHPAHVISPDEAREDGLRPP